MDAWRALEERLVWAFMAGFERWVIAKRAEFRARGEASHADAARLDRFLIRRRLDPAFDADILRRQLADPKFLAHRKVLVDAILASILDEDAKHGTIKTLTSAPLEEAKGSPREHALGGGYTDRSIRTILVGNVGIARQPEERAGREAPYRTAFTPDDFAPEHLQRYRENLERESMKLTGQDVREVARACDDLRRVRPDAIADLRVFRDQVAASLQQLEAHSPTKGGVAGLRSAFFPCQPLLTIFYDHLMMSIGGVWFERADLSAEPDFLNRPLTFWFTANDAATALSQLEGLTQSREMAYLYGHFAALSLQKISKVVPSLHLWTALSKMPNIPDEARSKAFHNRSTVYLMVGTFGQAADDLRKACELAERAGNPYLVTVNLKCEAETRHKLGDKTAAGHLYARALDVAGSLTGNDLFGAYWNLASSFRRIGNLPSEAAYLDACLRVMDLRDARRRDVVAALRELERAGVVAAHIPLLEEQLNKHRR